MDTWIQGYRDAGIHEYRDTGIQLLSSIKVNYVFKAFSTVKKLRVIIITVKRNFIVKIY